MNSIPKDLNLSDGQQYIEWRDDIIEIYSGIVRMISLTHL